MSLFYKASVASHELFKLKEFTYVNDFNSNPDYYREATKLMDFVDELYIELFLINSIISGIRPKATPTTVSAAP